ncbi:MAG: hypothetical protein K5753_00025 [Clostridia bacterium]|nr:hypothetical protein [Clostridia bacterium]
MADYPHTQMGSTARNLAQCSLDYQKESKEAQEMDLNLIANDVAEQRVKTYLEENASEDLAKKVNEGVPVEKDGKTLIQKKTLAGFMRYATEEARKTAEKGARGACVDDNTVFGWAIHYFEEDAIEGELFNEDGTPYVKPIPKVEAKPYTPPTPKPKEPTLFDLIEESDQKQEPRVLDEEDQRMVDEEMEAKGEIPIIEPEDEVGEEPEQETPAPDQEKLGKQYSAFYQKYLELCEHNQGAIVAQRIGDFYEIFGEAAKTFAEAAEITLTSRAVGPDERVPMCGIPYHAIDLYFQKVADKGHYILANSDEEWRAYRPGQKVAVVDCKTGEYKEPPQEEPKQATDTAVIDRIVRLFKGQLEVML